MGELSRDDIYKLNKYLVETVLDKRKTIEAKISKVSYLIRLGADLNDDDRVGETILFWASAGGYKEMVELMLDSGVDIYAKDNKGNTALAIAFKFGNMEIVELLKEYKKKGC